MDSPPPFPESHHGVALRDLGLRIEGSGLEPVLAAFDRELDRAGLGTVRPTYYLADEWGVPFPSAAIAIPFYLARPDLTRYHAARTGLVEGATPADLLKYLRHEMGHVVNYAYRLYDREGWAARFGPFTRPYPEEYRPRPFSRSFVIHLPGWYAQKHPDEDWAETFAVWMTPGADWRREYAGWPGALAKLEYCDRVVRAVAGTPWSITPDDPAAGEDAEGEDVDLFDLSVADIYGEDEPPLADLPGVDGALKTVFDPAPAADAGGPGPDYLPAGGLIRSLEADVAASVFRWTGHFPERTLPLVRLLARRADELGLAYPRGRAAATTVAVTALVTALAMNHVHHGDYVPAAEGGDPPAPAEG